MSHRWNRWRNVRRFVEQLAARDLTCIAALVVALWGIEAKGQSTPPTPVAASPIVLRNLTAAQVFVGTVEPIQHAIIGSAVDGRVIEYPVEEGDRVEQNQKLAQLMTDTIQLELAAAQAELENRQQRLAELVNGARPEELEQARALMAAAQARREFLRMRRDRLQSVSNRAGAVTEDEIDEAVALAIEADEAYQQAKAAFDLTVAGTRVEQLAQARALVALQQAVVDRISDQITKHTIISRFGGYVVMQHTEVGQWVNQGDPVAEVVAIDEVDVVAQVVEKSAPFIRPGEIVRVEIPAVPERMFEGRVVTTVPQADVRARTFPVKVRVKNEIGPAGPLLKAGMYARVALPVGGQQAALLVPKDAIVLGGPTPAVFVVEGDAAAGAIAPIERVAVTLGVADGSSIQILGNVRAGQLVVFQGNERLIPGKDVKLLRIVEQASAAARPIEATSPSSADSALRRSPLPTSTVAN